MKNVIEHPRYTLYLADRSEVTLVEPYLLESLRQKKLQYAKRDDVKEEILYSGSFLRQCLTEYGIDLGNKPLEVYYNFKAKPYPESRDYFYNISHSGNYLAIVVSREEVGVDVEERKPLKVDISGRLLSEAELIEYQTLSEEQKNDYLISAWTKKESIGKCIGEGVTSNLWEELGDTFQIDTFKEDAFFVSVCYRK